MIERKELPVGEMYLTIELDLGVLGKHKASAFRVPKTPDLKEGTPGYKGKGVAVWVNVKKKPTQADRLQEAMEDVF